MAHRLPRKLGLLHSPARARRTYHAERPVLRTASFRHRRSRPGGLPADAARACRQTADVHARRHQAYAPREPSLFLRMRGQFRHGMARRAAQWLPIYPRHGSLRDVYRRAAEDPAERSRREDEREMAAAGGRRFGRHDALAADGEGARRRADRLSHERRDALSRKRLSGARGHSRLGSQYVGEVAAADRGRRPALASPRGNLEIHRPARKRQGRAASPM